MSDRSAKVSRLRTHRAAREAYIKGKLSVLIPAQIRALRLKSKTPKQEELAREAGMKQSRISTMEKPGAASFNLDTLVRVASALKVGLMVEFVPFSTMLDWENGFSQDQFNVVTLDEDSRFTGIDQQASETLRVRTREIIPAGAALSQVELSQVERGRSTPETSDLGQERAMGQGSVLGQQLALNLLPPNVLKMPRRTAQASTSAVTACAMP